MKKVLLFSTAMLLLVMTSCSKENKINKRLEGTWKATLVDGVAPASGEEYTMEFTKTDKTTGTGKSTVSGGGVSFSVDFTYVLAEDKMTTTTTYNGLSSTDVVTITKYEKDAFEFVNSNNEKTVLEPK